MPLMDQDRRIKKAEERIEKSEEISEANRKTIKEFVKDLRVKDYSKPRIYKYLSRLKIIAEEIDFDFREADKEDIKSLVARIHEQDYSDTTKNDYKIIIKRFYRWIGDGEYPESVDWINTTNKKNNETLPKQVLDEEDISELIKACNNPRDKALVSILWETGARIGELIDLKIEDLEDYEHGKKIVIEGKTGARRAPLISSVPYIQAWINSHPDGENPEAPLWVNVGSGPRGKR